MMKEGVDVLAFRADAGCLVDQGDARGAAAVQGRVEVVDGETEMVDAGAARVEELCDGRSGVSRFEELEKRLTRGECGDSSAIRIVDRRFGQAKDVAAEGQEFVDGTKGHANMGEAGAAEIPARRVRHAGTLARRGFMWEPRRDSISH